MTMARRLAVGLLLSWPLMAVEAIGLHGGRDAHSAHDDTEAGEPWVPHPKSRCELADLFDKLGSDKHRSHSYNRAYCALLPVRWTPVNVPSSLPHTTYVL